VVDTSTSDVTYVTVLANVDGQRAWADTMLDGLRDGMQWESGDLVTVDDLGTEAFLLRDEEAYDLWWRGDDDYVVGLSGASQQVDVTDDTVLTIARAIDGRL
jgi:hypothetical protein